MLHFTIHWSHALIKWIGEILISTIISSFIFLLLSNFNGLYRCSMGQQLYEWNEMDIKSWPLLMTTGREYLEFRFFVWFWIDFEFWWIAPICHGSQCKNVPTHSGFLKNIYILFHFIWTSIFSRVFASLFHHLESKIGCENKWFSAVSWLNFYESWWIVSIKHCVKIQQKKKHNYKLIHFPPIQHSVPKFPSYSCITSSKKKRLIRSMKHLRQ